MFDHLTAPTTAPRDATGETVKRPGREIKFFVPDGEKVNLSKLFDELFHVEADHVEQEEFWLEGLHALIQQFEAMHLTGTAVERIRHSADVLEFQAAHVYPKSISKEHLWRVQSAIRDLDSAITKELVDQQEAETKERTYAVDAIRNQLDLLEMSTPQANV